MFWTIFVVLFSVDLVQSFICIKDSMRAVGIILLLSLANQSMTRATSPPVISEEKQLISMLLNRYEEFGKFGRPVNNTQDTIHVKFAFAIIQLLDLDEKKQVLTSMVWHRYLICVDKVILVQIDKGHSNDRKLSVKIWHDNLLHWDPSDFGGVDKVRLPADRLWSPDIVLYNAVEPPDQLSGDLLVVSHDGQILWVPSFIIKSSCSVNVLNFPFDTQNCRFKYGSWSYDGFKLDVDFNGEAKISMNDYFPSTGWNILESPATKHTEYYPCCPEPFPDLTFYLKIRRRSEFFAFILIMPSLLLSSLTFVIFLLPPSSGERIGMGLNIFLSYFMLLLILVESTPHSAATIPRLGLYLCANMSMIAVSIFLSSIIANLNENGDRGKPVTKWVRKVFIDVLARIICKKACVPCPDWCLKKRSAYDGVDMSVYTSAKFTAGHLHRKVRTNSPADGGSNNNADGISADVLQPLTTNLRSIAKCVQILGDRLTEKDTQERIAQDWRVVAVVLDRLFIIGYSVFVIITLIIIFPKPDEFEIV